MKKFMCLLLALAMVMSMMACGTPAETTTEAPAVETTEAPVVETEPAGIYTPGTYTAEAQGFSSKVKVTVTVDANNITEVKVDASGETPALGGAAADKLAKQVMDAQGAEIDGASGATMTSNAVKTAVADCLAQAGGKTE